MKIFACTRMMPVGGSSRSPKYEMRTILVKARNGPEAAATASDHQAEEKIRMFGRASHD